MPFRLATPEDLTFLIVIDQFAQTSEHRRADLVNWISRGEVTIAESENLIVGFVALHHDFFGHGFIRVVHVAPAHQRQGHGASLLAHAAQKCTTSKLFTSTNSCNIIAQALFRRAGFALSGSIENLDEGDNELVYFKAVAAQSGQSAG